MRKLSLMLFAAMTLGLIGCGGKDGPAEPASLSQVQIEAANREQKQAEDEEKAHNKADRKVNKRPVDSVDEEEYRARGGR